MLYDTHVAKVVIEHRDIDALDDVVVYYAPPGVNDGGTAIGADFVQLKFHVAQSGVVDHEAVIDPAWTGTKEPLLKRFARAWTELRASHPKSRLKLMTNWPWDTASPVRARLRDGGHLDDEFFEKGPRSAVGKIRRKWQEVCDLGASDFLAFARTLRFSTSAVSQGEAGDWLRDRCHAAGLVVPDPSLEWSPYDDLGKRLIETGRTEHTPESLRKLMAEQQLLRQATPPFQSTFAVRSFRRFAHVPETEGRCVVDLTDLFKDRRPEHEGVWAGEIKQRIDGSVGALEQLKQPVHVALDAHLSIAWYAGTVLNSKSGVAVALRQQVKGKGVQLWDVSAPRRPADAPDWNPTPVELGDGSELAVVVSVTHDALEDAMRSIASSLPAVGAILHLRLPTVGSASIVDGGHARWLADGFVGLVRAEAARRRPGRIHLFPASPASLMFLLGQEAAALGPTTVHEFSFGDPARAYRPGMSTDSESV